MTPHGTQSSSPTDRDSIPYPNAHCKLFFQTCHGDGSKRLKKGSDYTLSYENNVRIGAATITVTGKGFFTGTTWLSFNIVPRGTRFTKGTGLKKAVRLEWKKVNGVSGYDIQYTSENHQAGGGFVVSYPTQTQYTLSNLAAGKTYTFNIRTFVTVGGQYYYSPWSRAIKVKTK